MATTKGYVVGAKLLASGLARRIAPGQWQQLAHNHPFMSAVEADPHDPSSVYVAAGNGLIRVPRQGDSWRMLTGQDVTELRDLSIDAQGRIFFAHSAGVRMSADRGKSWTEISGNLRRKYTEAIRVDPAKPGVMLAGGEDGIWRTENTGDVLAARRGRRVRHHENRAVTARFLLLARRNAGRRRICLDRLRTHL